MATHSGTLPWRIRGQRSLVGYSPWGHKESDMCEQLTHSHPYMTTGKIHIFDHMDLCWQSMSLLFNMLSRFVIPLFSKEQSHLHDSKGSEHQGSSKLSWLVTFWVLSTMTAMTVSVVHDFMRRGQLEALLVYMLLSWTWPQTSLLLG